ncbi:acyl-CoA reductase [Dyadobacter tibetensis]|uniref:acyl-CoA reductase n=1 Tax=Dyadobacter tibetensis TaxID=1211851 RepID=UPI0004B5B91B|nr:acyl-CoA reductase [Dyadobacter tibetensis]
MISRKNRIDALVNLGKIIGSEHNKAKMADWAEAAYRKNNWFTPELVSQSLQALAEEYLHEEKLNLWSEKYIEPHSSKKIGVVMAGNIPAVGFHDALCVLVSGHQLMAKLSSDDQVLMNLLFQQLIEIEPRLKASIQVVERLNTADAYIATGSDNTARYFHHYFASKPHIIRKNRTSIAILSGEESREELEALGRDILLYYGLGCRNVSKLYVPVNYEFTAFYEAIEEMAPHYLNHHKFFNNYEYNKSIVLINRVPHLDNGFLILTESPALVSPISMLHYETYTSLDTVRQNLEEQKEKIQCVVAASSAIHPDSVTLGRSQLPGLNDYADNVDTMAFLQALS